MRLAASIVMPSVLVLAACSAQEQGVIQAQEGDPVIALSEGPCPPDTCPVYDMTLKPDGSYILNGVRFIKNEGVSEGQLPAEAWATAENVLEDARFWTLDPIQTSATRANCMPDAPTVLVTWRTETGKEKTLTYDAGCGARKVNQMISELRTALHFEELVWTDARFDPETGAR